MASLIENGFDQNFEITDVFLIGKFKIQTEFANNNDTAN